MKELKIPRYKHVVQVMLAEQTGAGCRYIARCRWDAEADSKISEFYKSESIICIVTVFGIYLYWIHELDVIKAYTDLSLLSILII